METDSAKSHTLDHGLLDAIHGSEGRYNVAYADSFYARMAEQDAQAPRMGESGGRLSALRPTPIPSAPAPPRQAIRASPSSLCPTHRHCNVLAHSSCGSRSERCPSRGATKS
ncbi:unnamed protein product [Closterium sp. NIES-64]|nr:unnamed protein product [Closterium sp. NIES-64]